MGADGDDDAGSHTAADPPFDARTDIALPLGVAASQLARVESILRMLDRESLDRARRDDSMALRRYVDAGLESIGATLAASAGLLAALQNDASPEQKPDVPGTPPVSVPRARDGAAEDTPWTDPDDDEGLIYSRRKPRPELDD